MFHIQNNLQPDQLHAVTKYAQIDYNTVNIFTKNDQLHHLNKNIGNNLVIGSTFGNLLMEDP